MSASNAFDAVKILTDAISKTNGLEIGQIKKTIVQTKNYPGASGEITFDSSGGVIKTPGIYRVKEGKLIKE